MKFELSKIDASKIGDHKTVGIMDENSCDKIIEKVKDMKSAASNEEAMALISGLCQRGGTNRRSSGIISYTFNGHTLTSTEFSRICSEIGNGTPRQFARQMADDIFAFAEILKEEGDLARQMRLDDPTITLEQAIWCANYQSENSTCPAEVRNWLKENRKSRFRS